MISFQREIVAGAVKITCSGEEMTKKVVVSAVKIELLDF